MHLAPQEVPQAQMYSGHHLDPSPRCYAAARSRDRTLLPQVELTQQLPNAVASIAQESGASSSEGSVAPPPR